MAQIVADNFTRANSTTLGANWTPWINVATTNHSPEIISNQAGNGSLSPNDSYASYTGAGWTGGADQYAECQITQTQAGGVGGGPLVRCTFGNGSNTARGYLAYVAAVGGSSPDHQLYRVDDGIGPTLTPLGSPFTLTILSTDVVRVEAQGTTIRYLVNGVVKQTATDATYATGTPGIHLERDTASGDSLAANWAAGDFSGGASQVPYQPNYFNAPAGGY